MRVLSFMLLIMWVILFIYCFVNLVSLEWVDNISRPDILMHHWEYLIGLFFGLLGISIAC